MGFVFHLRRIFRILAPEGIRTNSSSELARVEGFAARGAAKVIKSSLNKKEARILWVPQEAAVYFSATGHPAGARILAG